MNIVLISGKAQHAKDTSAQYIKAELTAAKNRVLVIHYADFLKWFCREYMGWNGVKDEAGRTLLQYVGTDVVRHNCHDTWVYMMVTLLKGIYTEYDYVIIPDTRFPNEIEVIKDSFQDESKVLTIRVERPGFDNGLSEAQKKHPSETALDNYKFDLYIKNDGDLGRLRNTAVDVAKWIMRQ